MKFLALFASIILLNPLFAMTSTEELVQESMLQKAKLLAKSYSGNKDQWQHPYGRPNPDATIQLAQNWLAIYPYSLITDENETFLSFISSDGFWEMMNSMGFDGVHTCPLRLSGTVQNEIHEESKDGGFDPIDYSLSPSIGTEEEYQKLLSMAEKHRSIIIGDIVTGHTGRGADFHLALQNYEDYPGIYHMVEIDETDWNLLPKVLKPHLSQNLSFKSVDSLRKKGYISGNLERVFFSAPGFKESSWSATTPIKGTDGKERRWVYLHYFKEGQPSLNWLDPSFAANRIIAGDIITSVSKRGQKIVRLDANGFLGIEKNPNTKRAFSEGHPLSVEASDLIAQMTRKLGGHSFQELNLGLLSIKAFSENGADLSYDFLLRSAMVSSLIHQNTDLLKISYDLLKHYALGPKNFVHALQNHDEFNYELIALDEFSKTSFPYKHRYVRGAELAKTIRTEDLNLLQRAPFNHATETGPAGTMVSIIAAALGFDKLPFTSNEIEEIKKAHLLLAFFSAMQPGVFAISGWDLVGALPLQEQDLSSEQRREQDYRWLNRGGYDLITSSNQVQAKSGTKKAKALYGPIQKQLKNKDSFASQIKQILQVRKSSNIATATFIEVVPSKNPSLLLLLHKLPASANYELTALNFSKERIMEEIQVFGTEKSSAIDLFTRKSLKKTFESSRLSLEIEPLSARAILFQRSPAKRP